jgi:hypothetical protein
MAVYTIYEPGLALGHRMDFFVEFFFLSNKAIKSLVELDPEILEARI